MKLIIKKQFDKVGDEFLDEKEIEIEIEKVDDEIIIKFNDEMLIIPVEAFFGIIN